MCRYAHNILLCKETLPYCCLHDECEVFWLHISLMPGDFSGRLQSMFAHTAKALLKGAFLFEMKGLGQPYRSLAILLG
jgi:hypothetical protein